MTIKHNLFTRRFDIISHEVGRNAGHPRTVFQAWFHSEDIPHPVFVVTINEAFINYIEWMQVMDGYRRDGIATEVLTAIEKEIGNLGLEPVTPDGKAFAEIWYTRPRDETVKEPEV